ncbi:MAG: AAA family ATPase [Alphaproteobacteria bacterium]|nr:AAA family ATPase [Alphaproteobacteria bacterium]
MILRINIQAFCLNEDTVAAILALADERLLIRSSINAELGGSVRALEALETTKTPDLIIVETAAEGEALFAELDSLANVCEPGTRVILIGIQNDIALFRELMKMGVSEYMVTPIETSQLLEAIVQSFQGDKTDRSARMIASIAACGGAGSSEVAYCLASELSTTYDSEVIIVDMDIFFGTSALAFNLQPQQTIVDALTQFNRLDPELLERFLVDVNDKISILAAPAALTANIQISAEAVDAVLSLARQMTDFVIVDLPHRWDPWVLDVLVNAEEVILVTEPDLMNLRDAKNMLELLSTKRGKNSPARLVFNKVGKSSKTELSGSNFKKMLKVEPEILIPYDPGLFGAALNNGEIPVTMNEKSKVASAIKDLAALVSGKTPVEKPKKKLFSFFK